MKVERGILGAESFNNGLWYRNMRARELPTKMKGVWKSFMGTYDLAT